jgi:TolB protein
VSILLGIFLLQITACGIDARSVISPPPGNGTQPENIKPLPQKQNNDLVFARQEWIYFLPATKKQPQKIIKGSFPSLNADKTKIAYVKPPPPEVNTEAVLMLYDLKTKKNRELYRVKGIINYPRFAPVGDLVLFTLRTSEGKIKLEIFNIGGEESLTINETNKEINDFFSPVWAPDGNTIYFHDMTNLFHVSFDGQILKKTPLAKITGSRETISSSDWFIPSPQDESLLIFTRMVPGTPLFDKTFGEPNTAIFIYDLRQNNKTRLTPENVFAIDPIWSPDGGSVYFTGYYDKNGRENYPFRIFRIDKNGRGLSEITRGENAFLQN